MKVNSTDNIQQQDLLSKLTGEIDQAIKLLRESQHIIDSKEMIPNPTLPSALFDQCLALCKEHSEAKPEPIRTVHHFACTGGSLISKCIASMPNIQLLSEVDPLSTLRTVPTKQQFTPTDMVELMRQSTRGTSAEFIINIFLNNLEAVYSNSLRCGLRLVLRDHAHSHYCKGASIAELPNLLGIIATKFPTLSVVTVRDPIDSYLSLKFNGWVQFSPPTFDEYCARYAAFIRSYEGCPIIRFEDFVIDPPTEMKRICDLLNLPFNPDFQELFSVHKISGDSGRTGDVIEARPQRSMDAVLLNEIEKSSIYQYVRSMLGYSSGC